MNTLLRKATSVALTFSLTFGSFVPAALAQSQDFSVVGNGAESENTINASDSTTTTVVQSNEADFNNNVNVDLSTGGNDALNNTGGDVTILTGDATAKVDISNVANLNKAIVDSSKGGTDTSASIQGNGAFSDSKISLDQDSKTQIFQDNVAKFDNKVDVDATTGNNDVNRNTGGDVAIVTGNAQAGVKIDNVANANVAKVGGDKDSGSSLDALIVGNGAKSDNKIDIDADNKVLIVQDNLAKIRNNVDLLLKTGDNKAINNTGGDVLIDTGKATALVDISNLANFNFASIEGALLLDKKVKISGNGAFSDNKVKLDGDRDLAVFQGCDNNKGDHKDSSDSRKDDCFTSDNFLKLRPDTGDNSIKGATSKVDKKADPTIVTGNTLANAKVDNVGNANIFSTDGDIHLPGNLVLDLDFDLHSLLGLK